MGCTLAASPTWPVCRPLPARRQKGRRARSPFPQVQLCSRGPVPITIQKKKKPRRAHCWQPRSGAGAAAGAARWVWFLIAAAAVVTHVPLLAGRADGDVTPSRRESQGAKGKAKAEQGCTQGCTLHVAWNHGKSGETPNPAQEGDVSGSDTVLGPALSPAALGTAPPNRADASSATAAGRHCTASPKPPRAADTVPSPAGLQSSRGSSPSPICSIPQAKGQSSAPQFASAVLSMCRATQKYFHILVQKQLQKL